MERGHPNDGLREILPPYKYAAETAKPVAALCYVRLLNTVESIPSTVEGENAEGFFGIGRIGGGVGAVLGAVFNAPFEREAGKDKNPTIVFAVVVKFFVSRHYTQSPAAQSLVQRIDAGGHLDSAALEGGAE